MSPMFGNRAGRAAIYPPELVEEIVQGPQLQRECDLRRGSGLQTLGLSKNSWPLIPLIPLIHINEIKKLIKEN